MRPASLPLRARRRTAAALAACLAFGALGAAPAGARPAQDPGPTTTTTSVDELPPEGDNPQLAAEYQDALAQQAQLQQQLDTARRDALLAAAKLQQLQRDTARTQLELLGAQDRLAKATTVAEERAAAERRAAHRAKVALRLLRHQAAALYVRGGNTTLLEAILSSRTNEDINQAIAYGNAATGSTKRLLDALQQAREEQRRLARAARRARADATAARDRIAAAGRFLVEARNRQATLVFEVSAKAAAVNETLLEVQTRGLLAQGRMLTHGGSAGGLGALLANLQRDQPDYQLGAVEIANPLPGAKPSSPFGIRLHPILHTYRLHAGCDIGSAQGTPVHAAADGVVVLAQVTGGYGNTTVIDHGNSLATLYGHQVQLLVTVGQRVKRGDVIGRVGSTGLSTGPHLHFETRIKGVPVDPEVIVDFSAPPDPATLAAPIPPAPATPPAGTTTTSTPG